MGMYDEGKVECGDERERGGRWLFKAHVAHTAKKATISVYVDREEEARGTPFPWI